MARKLSLSAILSTVFIGGAAFLLPSPASADTCPNGKPKVFGECPAPDAPDAKPKQKYTDDNLQLTFGGCALSGRQARCELWVDVAHRLPWYFGETSALVTADGGRLGVRDMAIGRNSMTVWNIGYKVVFFYLEPEIRTKLTYTFNLDTAPDQIQAVLIELPNHRFAKFTPEWQ